MNERAINEAAERYRENNYLHIDRECSSQELDDARILADAYLSHLASQRAAEEEGASG